MAPRGRFRITICANLTCLDVCLLQESSLVLIPVYDLTTTHSKRPMATLYC